MKVEVKTYEHASNGISIQVIPETDAEEMLLNAMWLHGEIKTGHPCKARGGTGFYVTAFKESPKEPTP